MSGVKFTTLALAASLAFPAVAQSPCAPYSEVLSHLESKYQEHPVSFGVTATGNMLVVTASKKGTWTILIVQTNGTACLVLTGDDWSEKGERS